MKIYLSFKALKDLWATFVMGLCPFSNGMGVGWAAVGLPELRNGTLIQATLEEGSWIASFPFIGAAAGCILGAVISDRLGRISTMIVGCIPLLAGYLLVASASTVEYIMVGRFIGGMGGGLQTGIKQVYISEISEARLRGLLGSTNGVFYTSGIFLGDVLGVQLPVSVVAWAACVPPLIMLFSLLTLPESPAYLVAKGKEKKAVVSLKKLRGENYNINEEIGALLAAQQCRVQIKKCTILKSKAVLRPLLILCVIFSINYFSGAPAIISYASDAFSEVSSSISKETATLVSGGLQVVLTFLSSYLVHKTKKRLILVICSLGMGVTMGILASYMLIDSTEDEPLPYRWIPAVAKWGTILFSITGYQTIPWVLVGELFPLEVRGAMSSAVGCINFLMNFLTVRFYPLLNSEMHGYGLYFLYAIVALCGSVFCAFYVPETTGKTLEDIEKSYKIQNVQDAPNNPQV